MADELDASGQYAKLCRLAQAGAWPEALALMRVSDLPEMKAAFRITSAGDGKFEMVFRFPTIEAMHRADREWHEFRKATDQ